MDSGKFVTREQRFWGGGDTGLEASQCPSNLEKMQKLSMREKATSGGMQTAVYARAMRLSGMAWWKSPVSVKIVVIAFASDLWAMIKLGRHIKTSGLP